MEIFLELWTFNVAAQTVSEFRETQLHHCFDVSRTICIVRLVGTIREYPEIILA